MPASTTAVEVAGRARVASLTAAPVARLHVLYVFAAALVAIAVLYRQWWAGPGDGSLRGGGVDQNLLEWFFAATADRVAHLDNPLIAPLQNAPVGVNTMSNTAILGLAVPLAPLTWVLGPACTLLLVMTVGIAASVAAWFWLWPGRVRTCWRPLVTGCGIGGALALTVLAYPLYWQFQGPDSYGSLFWSPANAPRAFTEYPTQSIFGGPQAERLSGGADQNAFFGWPVLLLAAGLVAVLWRQVLVRAAAVLTVGAAVLSLGATIPLPGTAQTLPGPWRRLAGLPLFESLVEMRLALLCIPGLAIIVALAVARAQRSPSRPLAVAGVAAVLLPLATITPTTLRVVAWPEPPAFIAAHQWRDYVRPGGTLAVFPVPSQSWLDPLHWEVVENLGFAIPGGHFAGPDAGGRWGQYGAPARAATQLIDQVRTTGVVPAVDDSTRDAFVRDLWYWQADAVVIRPDESEDVVRRTINLLLGTAGERVGGLLVWRVPVIRTSSGEAR